MVFIQPVPVAQQYFAPTQPIEMAITRGANPVKPGLDARTSRPAWADAPVTGLIYDPYLGHDRTLEPPGPRLAFAGSDSVTPSLTIPFPPGGEITQQVKGPTLNGRAGPAFAGRGLQTLPRPSRIVTKFEPHFRERTLVKLSQLFEQLRAALGKSETATKVCEIQLFMADAYRESVQVPDARNLASAISLLQDFLRPHWSQISPEKISAVTETLDRLRTQAKVAPHVLESLQDVLSGILGGLTVELQNDEEEPAEPDDEL